MAARFSRRTIMVAGAGVITALGGAAIIASSRRTPRIPTGIPVAAAEVPVGGGTVFIKDTIVVTQPAEGEFQAFSSTCPHDKCDVGDVRDGEIICFCHGSRFGLDGSLQRGPARKGLSRREVEVVDDTVYVALPAEA